MVIGAERSRLIADAKTNSVAGSALTGEVSTDDQEYAKQMLTDLESTEQAAYLDSLADSATLKAETEVNAEMDRRTEQLNAVTPADRETPPMDLLEHDQHIVQACSLVRRVVR